MSSTERWTNDDGLNIKFGNERSVVSAEGAVSTMGDEAQAVFKITATDITSSDALLAAHPTVGIPDGAHIISATLYVTTAFTSGGAATLTMGLWNDDGDGTYSVLPFVGAWRQMPQVDSEYNKDFQREEYVTTARYGVKLYRPENLVCVLTDTDQV